MLENLLGWILLLLGMRNTAQGLVQGESTTSAVASASTTLKSSAVLLNDMASFERQFTTKVASVLSAIEVQNTATFSAITNTAKRGIVKNIQKRVNDLNQHQTTLMFKKLKAFNTAVTLMTDALKSLEKSTGKNYSSVVTLLSTASQKITEASSKVTEQAGKTYAIGNIGESGIKGEIAKVKQALEKDLQNTRQYVANARKAVGDAYKEYKKLGGAAIQVPLEEGVSSSTPTPTPAPTATPRASSTSSGTSH